MDRNVKSVESETIVILWINQAKVGFIKCTSSIFISISLLHDKNVSSVENQHHKGLVPCHRSVLDYLKIEVCLHSVYPIKIFIFFSVWDQSRVRSVQCMMGHLALIRDTQFLQQYQIIRKEIHFISINLFQINKSVFITKYQNFSTYMISAKIMDIQQIINNIIILI